MPEKRFEHKKVAAFINELFLKVGYNSRQAKILTNSLVETSLRGVDSHGIRLTPHYVNSTKIRRINTKPKFKFYKKAPGVGIMDADNGHGIIAGIEAMKKAMALAKKTGIGAVGVQNSTHFSAAAIYSLIAAKEDMIGLSFTHAESLVAPFGGKQAFLGTNPICFAAPCAGEEPFCLDMATSTVTRNKVLHYKENGWNLETNWAVDRNGRITLDPKEAAALFPFGGYKGYGLGLMVEIFCSILTGMSFGPFIPPMHPVTTKSRRLGHFFIAIDIKRFQPVKTFKLRMKKMVKMLRKANPADDCSGIKVAGDVEKEFYKERRKSGIPIGGELLINLENFSKEYSIPKLK